MRELRVSEAILLGSTQIKSVPFTRWDSNGGGCALGMAETALGIRREWKPIPLSLADAFPLEHRYPWLARHFSLPCQCLESGFSADRDNVFGSGVIAHIFNDHVHGYKDWSLEQLVDWVHANEPEPLETEELEVNAKLVFV